MKKSTLVFAAMCFAAFAGIASAAEVCAATSVVPGPGATVTVPGPENTTETFVVPTPGPGQKVQWVDETYKDLSPQIETVQEMRVRTVPKKYNVVKKKTVTDTKIVKVQPQSGRKPRLARGKTLRQKEYLKKETFMEPEEYLHPVQQTVYYEVDKIRKVPALVDSNDDCE